MYIEICMFLQPLKAWCFSANVTHISVVSAIVCTVMTGFNLFMEFADDKKKYGILFEKWRETIYL